MAGLPFPCPIAARRLFAGRSGPYHEVRLGWEIGKANGPLRRLARNGPFPIVPPERRQIAFFPIWSAMYSACRIARLTMVSVGFSAPPVANWLPSETKRLATSWEIGRAHV